MERLSGALVERCSAALDYLRSGGEIMIPIIGIAVWMWALIFTKLIQLHVHKQDEGADESVLTSTVEPVDRLSSPEGWRGKIIQEFLRGRTLDAAADGKLVESLVKRQASALERHVPTIMVLASVAPLLGLLGTVNGMISTFAAVSLFGTGNPRALAGGISEALITTQSGLAVAIPGLFLGNFIRRRVQRCEAAMERFGLLIRRQVNEGQVSSGIDSN